MDYKRYEEMREILTNNDRDYIQFDANLVNEFIHLYDEMHFAAKQEAKKYQNLSESYSVVLQDLLDSIPQVRHYYEAMKIKALSIKAIEEHEE